MNFLLVSAKNRIKRNKKGKSKVNSVLNKSVLLILLIFGKSKTFYKDLINFISSYLFRSNILH